MIIKWYYYCWVTKIQIRALWSKNERKILFALFTNAIWRRISRVLKVAKAKLDDRSKTRLLCWKLNQVTRLYVPLSHTFSSPLIWTFRFSTFVIKLIIRSWLTLSKLFVLTESFLSPGSSIETLANKTIRAGYTPWVIWTCHPVFPWFRKCTSVKKISVRKTKLTKFQRPQLFGYLNICRHLSVIRHFTFKTP